MALSLVNQLELRLLNERLLLSLAETMLMSLVACLGNLVLHTGTVALRRYFGLSIKLLILLKLDDRNALVVGHSHLGFGPFSVEAFVTHAF